MKKIGIDWFTLDSAEIQRYASTARGLSKIPGIMILDGFGDLRIDIHRSHTPLLSGVYLESEPDSSHTIPTASRDWLRPFQLEAIDWIRQRQGAILALDLGGGKTATATAAADLPVAVFSPVGVIDVWRNECKRLGWTHHLCQTEDAFKQAIKENKTDCFIMPYSRAYRLGGYFRGMELGTLIADEAHLLTNKYVTWTQEFRGIPRTKTLLLTATPVRNRLTSLWGLLDTACPRAFGWKNEFRQRYCGATPSPYGGMVDTGRTNQDELATRLTEVIYKRTRAQMQIPLPSHNRLLVELEVKEEVPSLKEILDSLHSPLGAQLTIRNMMRQHLSHKKAQEVDVERFISKHPRTVWWIWFKETADILAKRLKALGLAVDVMTGEAPTRKRTQILEEWGARENVGKPRALVASIAAAATGISLSNAEAAIFVDLDWTALNIIQAEKRHHRFGSHLKELWTYYLRVPGTIDDMMAQALVEKQEDVELSLGKDGTVEQMKLLLGETDKDQDETEIIRRLAQKLYGRG